MLKWVACAILANILMKANAGPGKIKMEKTKRKCPKCKTIAVTQEYIKGNQIAKKAADALADRRLEIHRDNCKR